MAAVAITVVSRINVAAGGYDSWGQPIVEARWAGGDERASVSTRVPDEEAPAEKAPTDEKAPMSEKASEKAPERRASE
jgi:hypothetical protein